jgi:hypothetical protein
MKINVCVFEPKGGGFAHFLYDPIKNVVLAMRDLGHEVRLQRNVLEQGQLNILWGAHQITDRATAESIVQSDIQYVLVQTELLEQDQVSGYGTDHYRYCYLPLLQRAQVVWDWSAAQVDALRRDGHVADLLKIGFHPDLCEIRPAKHKSLGVLFFGSVTPYRAQVFESLLSRNIPLHIAFDEVALYRNDMMSIAKVVLSVPQTRGGHLNAFRIIAAVNNRAFCLGERAGNSHWIDDCFAQAEPDDLASCLSEVLADNRLDARAGEQFDRLACYPTTGFLEPLIDRLSNAG